MAQPAPALILVSLHPEALAPGELLEAWHQRVQRASGAAPAATSVFIGRTRGTTDAGLPLDGLELEHYPGMTEAELERLAAESARRHGVWAVGVGHRVGPVAPGEAIVVVAVLADRRGPAQRCCQEVLEALKHEAPFWKREWSAGQGVWVAGNTPLAEPLP
ncbi:MAG: molybdenum cofactor biosynthesis protein MoaE [Cyanobacteria bacterium K_Offshore_surface_m2_239]|nr:molybdenum cofactor biosynthesis protein MoaE [Cyanobacteria bacterium K_Offshore_surface_m2_239]